MPAPFSSFGDPELSPLADQLAAKWALPEGEVFRQAMNTIDAVDRQVAAVSDFFDALAAQHPLLPLAAANDDLVTAQA